MKSATEQFIEDAIAGGWEKVQLPNAQTFLGEGKTIVAINGDHILLDPLAWQAVGKTRGWRVGGGMIYPEWKTKWHRFIDHLAAGKTIEEALAGIQ